MPNLTKYNTLAEALAFNLTEDDAKEFGYYRTSHPHEIKNTNVNYLFKFSKNSKLREFLNAGAQNVAYQPDLNMNEGYNYGSISNYAIEFTDEIVKLQKVHIQAAPAFCTVSHSSPLYYYENKNSQPGYKIDIDGTNNTTSTSKYPKQHEVAIKNNSLVQLIADPSLVYTNQFIFGEQIHELQKQLVSAYQVDYCSKHSEQRYQLNLLRKTAEKKTPFHDFRWYDTKLVWLFSDIFDGTLYAYSNNFAEGSIILIARDENVRTAIKAELSTMKTNCTQTITEFDVMMRKIDNNATYIQGSFYRAVYVGYISSGFLYLYPHTWGLNSLFVPDNKLNGGEAFPLDTDGYIDYSAIDYRKKYTNAIGAAQLNPRVISKLDSGFYTPVQTFNPSPTVPDKISITRQVYKKDYNLGILTIECGNHTMEDGTIKYNEIVSVTSNNNLINITKTAEGKYDISFISTATEQKEVLKVVIRQTFLANRDSAGINKTTVINLSCIADTDTVASCYIFAAPSVQTDYVSKIQYLNWYCHYEQFTDLPAADITTMNNAADQTAALACVNKYFVTLYTGKSDISTIKSISASGGHINVIYKGNIYDNLINQSLEGKHTYTYTAVADTSKQASVVINAELPYYRDPDPEPKPPGGGGGGGGGSGLNDFDLNLGEEEPRSGETEIIEDMPCIVVPVDESGNFDIDAYYTVKETTIDILYTGARPPTTLGGFPGVKNMNGGYMWNQDGKVFTNDCIMIDTDSKIHIIYAEIKDPTLPLPKRITLGSVKHSTPAYEFTYVPINTMTGAGGGMGCGYVSPGGGPYPSSGIPIVPNNNFMPMSEQSYTVYDNNGNTVGSINLIGNFNVSYNPFNLTGLKIPLRRKWEGFNATVGYILVGISSTNATKLCVAFEPMTEEEWRAKYAMPTDEEDAFPYLDHQIRQTMEEVQVDDGNGNITTQLQGTGLYALQNQYFDYRMQAVNGKVWGPGTYTGELTFTDVNGNTMSYSEAISVYDGSGYGKVSFGNSASTWTNGDGTTDRTRFNNQQIKSFKWRIDKYKSIDTTNPYYINRATQDAGGTV